MARGGGRLLFVVNLPSGTLVEHAVLGTSWDLKGSPNPCTVMLPGPPLDYEDFDRRLTRPAVNDAERALDWFEEDRTEDESRPQRFWGWAPAVNTERRKVIKAHVHRMVAVVSIDREPESDDARTSHSNEVGMAIDRWTDTLSEWLEVLVGLDLGGREVQSAFRPRHVHPLPLVDGGDRRWRNYATMSQGPTIRHTSPHANLSQWRLAVERANAGDSAPEEHLLLRDSRAAWLRNDPRKALIDAATAVEVALAAEIQRSLGPNASVEAIDRVLKNASGVIDLHDLTVALGTAIPVSRARLIHRLADRRNVAVHRGVAPSDAELGHALRLADSIVRGVRPLEGATDPWPLGSVSSTLTAC
jgi:hypothetical protein